MWKQSYVSCFWLGNCFSCYSSRAFVKKYLVCMKNISPMKHGVYPKVFVNRNSWWLSRSMLKMKVGCNGVVRRPNVFSLVVRKFFFVTFLWDFSYNLQILTKFWVNKLKLCLLRYVSRIFFNTGELIARISPIFHCMMCKLYAGYIYIYFLFLRSRMFCHL